MSEKERVELEIDGHEDICHVCSGKYKRELEICKKALDECSKSFNWIISKSEAYMAKFNKLQKISKELDR